MLDQDEYLETKILIVDDTPANLDALEAILSNTGFTIIRAKSGHEALRILLQHEFACCLLDIRMPDMDGYETASLIRNDIKSSSLPIIFVTAEANDQRDVFKGYDSGAVDFLIKPLEPAIVRSKVLIFGQLYQQKREIERAKGIAALNSELKNLNKSLHEANQDLEHFTQIAAHDLREPLRKQRNVIDLLIMNVTDKLNEESDTLLQLLATSSDQMLGMINDFRSFTKIGYENIKRENHFIYQIIDNCLASYQEEINRFNAKIGYDFESTNVAIYPSLVRILYNNLIKNIFDHVRDAGIEIIFTSERNNNQILFGVYNTGSEIPQDRLKDIFKMFRKWDSHHDGTGIGLSICKRIIDRHHGNIFAESGKNYSHIKFSFGDAA